MTTDLRTRQQECESCTCGTIVRKSKTLPRCPGEFFGNRWRASPNAVKDFFVAGFARIRAELRFIVAMPEVLRLQLRPQTPLLAGSKSFTALGLSLERLQFFGRKVVGSNQTLFNFVTEWLLIKNAPDFGKNIPLPFDLDQSVKTHS